MALVTLADAKDRLSIDFNDKDNEIEGLIASIEGSLFLATGIKNWDSVSDEKIKAVAKEYVLLRLYLDYYNRHTDLDNARLTSMLKQLQVAAFMVEENGK